MSRKDQHFALEHATLEMEEVVVTNRDPAQSIMERVIARKQIWREQLEYYRSEAYTRTTLKRDTSIVSISETVSEAFWDIEKGHHEILKSQKRTSNLGDEVNFTGVSYLPNFYDDDIEIAGFKLVGPTHPQALNYYHFELEDILRIDERPVYKINVRPRRILQPTFKGTLYILGEEYAMMEVDLKPNKAVRFPPPVRTFDLSYKQQFNNYRQDFWLPADIRINGLVIIETIGLRFPPIGFSQISRITDYVVNTELPDTLYRENRQFSVDTTTIDNTMLVEENLGRVPLTLEEDNAYESIDSTATLEEAFRPTGFLARAMLNDDNQAGEGSIGNSVNRVIPDGLNPQISFNRLEGFHLGIDYNHRLGRAIFQVQAGYNTHAKNWNHGGTIEYRWLDHTNVNSTLFGSHFVTNDDRYLSKYPHWLNSLSSCRGLTTILIISEIKERQPEYALE